MSVNFIPNINSKAMTPFRFWCQKVLPLVYDDSLSYYELLCKVVDYINKLIEDDQNLVEAYTKLQDYVNNYFDNLDVQEEINQKIDKMAEDGSLTSLIEAYVNPYLERQTEYNEATRSEVTERLDAQDTSIERLIAMVGSPLLATRISAMTDTNKVYVYVGSEAGYEYGNWYYYDGSNWVSGGVYNSTAIQTDTTLTMSGKAADAKATGDRFFAQETEIYNTEDRLSNIDGLVTINYSDWEIGGINFTTSGWEYGPNVNRVRPKQGTYYTLKAGDTIGLTDYASASFIVGIRRVNGTYGFTGTLRTDYTCPEDGDYSIVIRKHPTESPVENVATLLQYLFIKERANDHFLRLDNQTENIMKYNSFDLFSILPVRTVGVHNGVTFTPAKGSCTLTGTATNAAFYNLYHNMAALPDGFVANGFYKLFYNSANSNVRMIIYFYDINGETILTNTQYFTETKTFRIPINAVGMTIRINVNDGAATNLTVNYSMLDAYSNKDIENNLLNISYEGLEKYQYNTSSHLGITYTWDSDRNRCKVRGVSTGSSFKNIYYDNTALPGNLEPGDKIGIIYASSDPHIAGRVFFHLKDGADVASPIFRESVVLTIPENAIGFILRYYVYSGYSVDGYAIKPLIFKMENQQLLPYKANKPMFVSFIDDDTDTDDLVNKFFENCMHNNIRGSYAVVTKQYINGSCTISKLLDIEANGFNMIPHCQEQRNYLRPEGTDYDPVLTFKNYAQCLRDFRTLGLINPQNMWIIPYGDDNAETMRLARNLGFEMAFTTEGSVNNYLTAKDRYKMHRCGLSALANVTDDTSTSATGSMAKCKARVDELVNSETGGWLIIMTHFNTWQSETWNNTKDSNGYSIGYSRFNELVQYVKNAGCQVVSMAEGAAYMKPIIDRNFTMG